jgi:hypothetical protein
MSTADIKPPDCQKAITERHIHEIVHSLPLGSWSSGVSPEDAYSEDSAWKVRTRSHRGATTSQGPQMLKIWGLWYANRGEEWTVN